MDDFDYEQLSRPFTSSALVVKANATTSRKKFTKYIQLHITRGAEALGCGHLQELIEELWRLRSAVEMSGLHVTSLRYKLLISLLLEPDSNRRWGAANLLRLRPTRTFTRALLAALRTFGVDEKSEAVVYALWAFHDKRAFDSLIKISNAGRGSQKLRGLSIEAAVASIRGRQRCKDLFVLHASEIMRTEQAGELGASAAAALTVIQPPKGSGTV